MIRNVYRSLLDPFFQSVSDISKSWNRPSTPIREAQTPTKTRGGVRGKCPPSTYRHQGWPAFRRCFVDLSKTVRWQLENFSSTLRSLFVDISKTVRRPFKDLSRTFQGPFDDFSSTFRRLVVDTSTFRTRFVGISKILVFRNVGNDKIMNFLWLVRSIWSKSSRNLSANKFKVFWHITNLLNAAKLYKITPARP